MVIAINYIPQQITPDYLFLTNSRRYLQMSSQLLKEENRQVPIIATSNITEAERPFSYVVNYSNLIDEEAEFMDNSMMMLVRLLLKAGVHRILLAGFDGYTPDDVNYFDENMEYSFVKEKADSLNESGRQFFREIRGQAEIRFVTGSYYQE